MNKLIANCLRRPALDHTTIIRSISSSTPLRMKQIEITQEKDNLVIKGKTVPSGREPLLVKEFTECKKNGVRFCPECTLNLDVKHTDVLILSQYVRENGTMLPRRDTGLCKWQQKRIGTMVTMAHKAGLMGNLKPFNHRKRPDQRPKEKGMNTYFLEETIKPGLDYRLPKF